MSLVSLDQDVLQWMTRRMAGLCWNRRAHIIEKKNKEKNLLERKKKLEWVNKEEIEVNG